ncbi:hypothetical protein IW16_17035 [Chryseobacterium vrystaatense]|uniref:Uncharacterized protein n=2 Tax=Chryseobacterium vrystaatense TaxID=307480 RepID=A0ABR4UK65_9FLAO|nr:hypothetical protein IW16_17035 [Chryseobacterium vrystaatense]
MQNTVKTRICLCQIELYICREQGVKTLRKKEMNAEEKLNNIENQKTAGPKGKADSSSQKTKTEISNSFLQRIISLLKKEELI